MSLMDHDHRALPLLEHLALLPREVTLTQVNHLFRILPLLDHLPSVRNLRPLGPRPRLQLIHQVIEPVHQDHHYLGTWAFDRGARDSEPPHHQLRPRATPLLNHPAEHQSRPRLPSLEDHPADHQLRPRAVPLLDLFRTLFTAPNSVHSVRTPASVRSAVRTPGSACLPTSVRTP